MIQDFRCGPLAPAEVFHVVIFLASRVLDGPVGLQFGLLILWDLRCGSLVCGLHCLALLALNDLSVLRRYRLASQLPGFLDLGNPVFELLDFWGHGILRRVADLQEVFLFQCDHPVVE